MKERNINKQDKNINKIKLTKWRKRNERHKQDINESKS